MPLRTSLSFNPNILINGGMDFFQRSGGGSISSSTGGATIGGVATYFSGADRWMVRPGGAASATISRSTTVPDTRFAYSLRYLDTSGAAGKSAQVVQRIEAALIAPFIGQTVTFSVWIRIDTASAGTLSFELGVPTIGLDSWSADPNTFNVLLSSGSLSYTLGAWKRHSYSFVVPAGAVNGFCVDILANVYTAGMDMKITGAMLTKGTTAPSDFYRNGNSMDQELAACQRYFEKSYDPDVAMGSIANAGSFCLGILNGITNGNSVGAIPFKVTKRATPTVAVYSGPTGVADRVRYNGTDIGITSNTNNGVNACSIVNNNGAALATATVAATCQFAANAEL